MNLVSARWRALWLSSLILAGHAAQAYPEDPARSLDRVRDAVVANDLPATFAALLPGMERAAAYELHTWSLKRAQDPTMAQIRAARFEQGFGALIQPGAVDRIMDTMRPHLESMRLPMLAGQIGAFVEINKGIREDADLSPELKGELLALANAGQLYLARTDVLDAARFEAATRAVVRAARATGIVSAQQMDRLDLDQLLDRFSVFMKAGKQALRHYDLDADQVLRSMRFRTLHQDAEQAEVEVVFTLLDVTVHLPVTLYSHPDGWYLQPAPVERVGSASVELDPAAVADADAAAEAALAEPVAESGYTTDPTTMDAGFAAVAATSTPARSADSTTDADPHPDQNLHTDAD